MTLAEYEQLRYNCWQVQLRTTVVTCSTEGPFYSRSSEATIHCPLQASSPKICLHNFICNHVQPIRIPASMPSSAHKNNFREQEESGTRLHKQQSLSKPCLEQKWNAIGKKGISK
jgi:hypothetical protein